MRCAAAFVLIAVAGVPAAAGMRADRTDLALDLCLNDPAKASTADQTDCEASALRAYDRRMNVAYATLARASSADGKLRLRQAQRAWLVFRDADARARNALYATRQGTLYVPMAAASAVRITRDRALQLEAELRIVTIEP